jgi:hypothetical protein
MDWSTTKDLHEKSSLNSKKPLLQPESSISTTTGFPQQLLWVRSDILLESHGYMSGILEQTQAARQQVYEQICTLLVSAGYFRARIPALSPFDKVSRLFFQFVLLTLL